MGCGASTPKAPPLKDPLYPAEHHNAGMTKDQRGATANLTKYMATKPEAAPNITTEDGIDADAFDAQAAANNPAAISFSFAAPADAGKSIVHNMSAEEPAGSLLNVGASTSVMKSVDLGQLHEALKKQRADGSKPISTAAFGDALKTLLTGVDMPTEETIAALFRAFDSDGSGEVDEAELIAGCSQLCSGDPAVKLKLAFSCFDKDGDGHLEPAELSTLLRGTIAPAVSALHSAVDFASFSADESGADLDEINNEAGDAAALSKADEDGKVKVELKTSVGSVTIHVPAAALNADTVGNASSALSLEQFLKAVVDSAMGTYDTDKNGTLEMEEFVAFAAANPFLTAWFGRLAEKDTGHKSSWKDDFGAN